MRETVSQKSVKRRLSKRVRGTGFLSVLSGSSLANFAVKGFKLPTEKNCETLAAGDLNQ
jgi:hypothetical protein